MPAEALLWTGQAQQLSTQVQQHPAELRWAALPTESTSQEGRLHFFIRLSPHHHLVASNAPLQCHTSRATSCQVSGSSCVLMCTDFSALGCLIPSHLQPPLLRLLPALKPQACHLADETTSTSSGGSPAGAIAGGVAGGVAAVCLATGAHSACLAHWLAFECSIIATHHPPSTNMQNLYHAGPSLPCPALPSRRAAVVAAVQAAAAAQEGGQPPAL